MSADIAQLQGRLEQVAQERLEIAEACAKLNMETIQLQQQEIRKLEAELEHVRGLLKFANEGHYNAIEIRTYLASKRVTS